MRHLSPCRMELSTLLASRPALPVLALGLAIIAAACGASGQATQAPMTGAEEVPSESTAAAVTGTSPTGTSPTGTSPAGTSPAGTQAAGTTLDCTAPATPTIAQTEGPYYLAGAPETADLVTGGMAGTRLTLTGYVVDASCAPIVDAMVETWQADSAGVYDNSGYSLRGWVRTDAQGRFTIHTVVPGEYPGRTEHIHVKVTPPGGATLTSQLYFPGSTANGEDGIYDPSLDLTITEDGDALIGTYTFVLGS